MTDTTPDPATTRTQRLGFWIGVAAFVLILLLPRPAGMTEPAWRTAAVAALMAVWWVTEAIPLAATALVPLVLLPALGILAMAPAAAPYANPVIFLFLGGFLLAAALERSGLHRRLALGVVAAVGTRPERLVLGFLVASAAISMWVSNTATVLMLLPLATPVIELASGDREGSSGDGFDAALLLAIAYGASIGGIGTLIGTPPNALLAGFMAEAHGMRISFARYMLVGVPLVLVAVPLAWVVLVRVVLRRAPREAAVASTASASLAEQRRLLGPISKGELRVGIIAALTAIAWMFQPLIERVLPGASDTGIAMTAALSLFLVPTGGGRRALDWQTAERMPWGVLILFGGGLSLAAAIQGSGLALWLGEAMGGLRALPVFVVILLVTTLITALTEFTSNTATAAAFLPLASSLAIGIGVDPLLLAVPAALAASSGFMLPVGTPPNAIVFASGRLTIGQMARAGVAIDVIMVVLITLVGYFVVVPALR